MWQEDSLPPLKRQREESAVDDQMKRSETELKLAQLRYQVRRLAASCNDILVKATDIASNQTAFVDEAAAFAEAAGFRRCAKVADVEEELGIKVIVLEIWVRKFSFSSSFFFFF